MLDLGSKVKSFTFPGNGTGTIVKKYFDKKGENGEDLYDVLDENGEIHTIVPSLFDDMELTAVDSNNSSQDIDIDTIKKEINYKIEEIITELGLIVSDDPIIQLKNCCLVQRYIVENNVYSDNIMNEKRNYSEENIVLLDLYNALVLHTGVCTSNSLMFKKILERVGTKVEVIGLYSNGSNDMHASNIVEIDGKYYFFDSTLESYIYQQNGHMTNGEIVLCCAGLGKNEYCQLYSPQVVLPDDPMDDTKELPSNISEERILADFVNGLLEDEPNSVKK